MNHLSPPAPSCRSVFREPDKPLTKERYTALWVQLIHQLERSNDGAAGIQ